MAIVPRLATLLALLAVLTPSPASAATGAAACPDRPTGRLFKPAPGSTATVPAGRTARLARDVILTGLRVRGRLVLDDRADRRIAARWIVVEPGGALCIGSSKRPFRHRATITLTGGPSRATVGGFGTKVLGVAGRLEIHGERRSDVDWARLAAPARAGERWLRLDTNVRWRPGDRLVVASSEVDPHEAEHVEVRSASGREVELTEPLRNDHQATRNAYGGRVVEQRAEVGLLSRNVVIEGDESSDRTRFGAHVLVAAGGFADVEGVEIRRAGQAGRVGRYPFHWHMAKDVRGQSLTDASVHHSYNRFVTVHGTHNGLVRRVVGYDTIGHGFFLEDGVETGNTFDDVLGVLVRRPGRPIIESDTQPAVFWLANPNNTIRRSAAAGSEGQGFWFDLPERPTGMSAGDDADPRRALLCRFEDNVAHSAQNRARAWGSGSGLAIDDHEGPSAPIERFTAYKNESSGVWTGSERLVDARLADNPSGVIAARGTVALERSVVAGRSAPDVTAPAGSGPVTAILAYDGNVASTDTVFANLQDFTGMHGERRRSGVIGLAESKASNDTPFSTFTGSRLTDASVTALPEQRSAAPIGSAGRSRTIVFTDVDGSLAGRGPGTIVHRDNGLQLGPGCAPLHGQAAFCSGEDEFGTVKIGGVLNDVAPIVRRSDGTAGEVALHTAPSGPGTARANLPLGTTYTLATPLAPGGETLVELLAPRQGASVRVVVPWSSETAKVDVDGRRAPLLEAEEHLDRHPVAAWVDRPAGRLVVRLTTGPHAQRDGTFYARLHATS